MRVKVQARKNAKGVVRYTGMYQMADGTWRGIGTYGDKKIARKRAEIDAVKFETGQTTDPRDGNMTVSEYTETHWLPGVTAGYNARRNYQCMYRKHIKPHLGDTRLRDITPSSVGKWLATLDREGLAVNRQREVFSVLSRILRLATSDRMIVTNPCAAVTPPRRIATEVRIFTPDEVQRLILALPPWAARLVSVGIDTGMRSGELRALCPAQVDFLRRTITVNRAWIETVKSDTGAVMRLNHHPKGKRPRRIRATDEVIEILAAQMERLSLSQDSEEPILLDDQSRVIPTYRLTKQIQAACKALGIKDRSFKHLRSSNASWMLAAGVDLMRVKDHLGHVSVASTQKYLTALQEPDEEMANVISDLRAQASKRASQTEGKVVGMP